MKAKRAYVPARGGAVRDLALEQEDAYAIAVDATDVYFTTRRAQGTVAKVSRAGGRVTTLADDQRNPIAIASYPAPKPSSYQALQDAVVVEYFAPAPDAGTVWLKLVRSGHQATGWFSTDRLTWKQVGQAIDIKVLRRPSALGVHSSIAL